MGSQLKDHPSGGMNRRLRCGGRTEADRAGAVKGLVHPMRHRLLFARLAVTRRAAGGVPFEGDLYEWPICPFSSGKQITCGNALTQ